MTESVLWWILSALFFVFCSASVTTIWLLTRMFRQTTQMQKETLDRTVSLLAAKDALAFQAIEVMSGSGYDEAEPDEDEERPLTAEELEAYRAEQAELDGLIGIDPTFLR